MLTNAGLGHVADQMAAKAQAVMSHMAIGIGTNAAGGGDTALQSENYRKALTSKTNSGAVVTYVCSFGNGEGSGNITELGILNAASAGTLLNRIVFSAKNKASADTLEFTVAHTYQNAA